MTQTTTLIAIARNAGPFWMEWVTYRRVIEFDHVVIMPSPSEDGTETLLGTHAIIHVPPLHTP